VAARPPGDGPPSPPRAPVRFHRRPSSLPPAPQLASPVYLLLGFRWRVAARGSGPLNEGCGCGVPSGCPPSRRGSTPAAATPPQPLHWQGEASSDPPSNPPLLPPWSRGVHVSSLPSSVGGPPRRRGEHIQGARTEVSSIYCHASSPMPRNARMSKFVRFFHRISSRIRRWR
jgi:hypothetical protein